MKILVFGYYDSPNLRRFRFHFPFNEFPHLPIKTMKKKLYLNLHINVKLEQVYHYHFANPLGVQSPLTGCLGVAVITLIV